MNVSEPSGCARLGLLAFVAALSSCALDGVPDQTAPADAGGLSSAERFLRAFRNEQYARALEIAERLVDENPEDGTGYLYRASALTMRGKDELAVESFRVGFARLEGTARDPLTLYLRALARHRVKAYRKALESLDALARLSPHGRLAEKGQEIATAIQETLAAGAGRETLNWYYERGLAAQANARPALALEYLEEYLAWADAVDAVGPQRDAARLAAGACSLELALPREAVAHLELVPPSASGYRAGLFLAMALGASGQRARALALLEELSVRAEPAVQRNARRLAAQLRGE
jgi:tetratricopeptide (TPR) repeat protein